MQHSRMIIVGGASFIVGALAFVFVFSYLAANFNYPDILDGTAAEVLPRLRDGGSTMRAVWAVYAFLPLFLVPGAVAAFFLLSGVSMLAEARFPKWLGWSGVAFSFSFLVGASRNVTNAVQVVADINNGLLPLWMIVIGAALIWFSRRHGSIGAAEEGAPASAPKAARS
jgi:hypothetical protein